MAGADAATIREWVSKAEADIATLTAQAEDIQRRLAQSRIQLGLMYELLASLGDEAVSPRADLIGAERSVRERVVHSAVQVLQDRGAPMRIQDIHAEFLRRQLPLPGSGTPTNIAAHLVDRGVFTRPGRGLFGLTEWGHEEAVAARESTFRRSLPRS
jgi:hypothetical protein